MILSLCNNVIVTDISLHRSVVFIKACLFPKVGERERGVGKRGVREEDERTRHGGERSALLSNNLVSF